MTPLNQIKEGILNADWSLVSSGYETLTGERVAPKQSITTLCASAEKMKAAIIEALACTDIIEFDRILQIAMGISQLHQIMTQPAKPPSMPTITTHKSTPPDTYAEDHGIDLEKTDQPVADSELVVSEEVQTKDGVVKIISAPSSSTTKKANEQRAAAKPVTHRPPAQSPTVPCTACGKPVKVAIMPPKDVGVKCSSCIRRGAEAVDSGDDE